MTHDGHVIPSPDQYGRRFRHTQPRRMQVLTGVVLLESMPQTFVGLRNGVSLALVIVVVAEMFIGSTDGLGHRSLRGAAALQYA